MTGSCNKSNRSSKLNVLRHTCDLTHQSCASAVWILRLCYTCMVLEGGGWRGGGVKSMLITGWL